MSDSVFFLDAFSDSVRQLFLTYESEPPTCDERSLIHKGDQLQIYAKGVLDQLQAGNPTVEACKEVFAHVQTFQEEQKKYSANCRPNFPSWFVSVLYTFVCGKARFPKVTISCHLLEQQSERINSEFSLFLSRCKKEVEKLQSAGYTSQALQQYRAFCQILPEERNFPFLQRVGDCYQALSLPQKAFECFEQLSKNQGSKNQGSKNQGSKDQGDETKVLIRKASCLLDLGRPEEAEVLLQSVLEKKEHIHEKSKKKAQSKFIIAKIQKRDFVAAMAACLDAIREFPQENNFRLQLIEAYLSIGENGRVFIENIELLHSYFAEQNCYLQLARTFDDLFVIFFDFFDYASRRSIVILEYMENLLSSTPHKEKIASFLSKTMQNKLDQIQSQLQGAKKQLSELNQEVPTAHLDSEEKVAELQVRFQLIAQDVMGQSPKALIPIGTPQYLRSFAKVIETYVSCSLPIKENEEFIKMRQVSLDLQREVLQLHTEIAALREHLQRRLVKERQAYDTIQEEELSLEEWTKRQKVFAFLEEAFIPIERREKSREFLSESGITLDQVFTTDLLQHTHDLPGFLQQIHVHSLADLSKYVHESSTKE